jgi:hypothetical protein
MKKIILLSALIFFTSLGNIFAQNYPVNPIPSFNFQLATGQAVFSETKTVHNTREKRDMDVVISTTNHSRIPVFAKVWVVKANGHVVKGPYRVVANQQLSVPIDNGSWGVVVKCDWEVSVDVWID